MQCVVIIVLGSIYIESCEIDVPAFLIVCGSVHLGMSVIGIGLTIYIESENDIGQACRYCIWGCKLAYNVASLALNIWGTILVLGNYSDVTYTRDVVYVRDIYCDKTPFIFAMIIVILSWIWIPICICVLGLWGICVSIAMCCICISNRVQDGDVA